MITYTSVRYDGGIRRESAETCKRIFGYEEDVRREETLSSSLHTLWSILMPFRGRVLSKSDTTLVMDTPAFWGTHDVDTFEGTAEEIAHLHQAVELWEKHHEIHRLSRDEIPVKAEEIGETEWEVFALRAHPSVGWVALAMREALPEGFFDHVSLLLSRPWEVSDATWAANRLLQEWIDLVLAGEESGDTYRDYLPISYDLYLKIAKTYHHNHPQQRWGQVLFNTLTQTHPKLAEKVRGSLRDPFYRDDVGEFLAWLAENV